MAALARPLPMDSATAKTLLPSATSRTLPSGSLIEAIIAPMKVGKQNRPAFCQPGGSIALKRTTAHHPVCRVVVVVKLIGTAIIMGILLHCGVYRQTGGG